MLKFPEENLIPHRPVPPVTTIPLSAPNPCSFPRKR
jgi:hypothetical protein